jgi:putative transposase
MLEKVAGVIAPILNVTKVEIIIDLILSFYRVPYAITTRSLARYSDRSLRSWFRFLSGTYDWTKCKVALFAKFIYKPKTVYVLGADETMQTKSRHKTYGIDWFYNSIVGFVQQGVGFLGMALIDVESKSSYHIGLQQIVRTADDKARTAALKVKKATTTLGKKSKKNTKKKNCTTAETSSNDAIKRGVGRPKGSKNKAKTTENVIETPSLRYFKQLLDAVMVVIKVLLPNINLKHIVGDNAYATLAYMQAALAQNLFLISKLKRNSVIQLPYIYPEDAPYKSGRPKVYGNTVANENPPKEFLKTTVIDEKEGTRTETYQLQAYAAGCFAQILLNIIIVRTEDIASKKVSVLIFFSNDLTLSAQQIWDYYHVRYQIEFDFRDAKQYFGFAAFKNYIQNNVTNIVNLSFLLCIISKILLPHYRQTLGIPHLSIRDLKIIFNTRFSLKSFFNLSPKAVDSIFNSEQIDQFIPAFLTNAA